MPISAISGFPIIIQFTECSHSVCQDLAEPTLIFPFPQAGRGLRSPQKLPIGTPHSCLTHQERQISSNLVAQDKREEADNSTNAR